MYGKRRPLAILWYQLHVSGGFHFSTVLQKGLGRTKDEGERFFFFTFTPRIHADKTNPKRLVKSCKSID